MYDAPSQFNPKFGDHIISLEEIKLLAGHAHAKHVLFAFDSCFSGYVLAKEGGRVRNPPIKPSFAYFLSLNRPNVEFLTASGAEQETDALSHFTPNFIAGIEGLADQGPNRLGFVTAKSLWTFIDRQMADVANQPEFGYLQSDNGDMVFKYPRDHQAVPIRTLRFVSGGGDENLQPGVPIVYFRHLTDGPFVQDALNSTGLHYLVRGSLAAHAEPANAIACSPKSPITLVRSIALAMLERNVRLKYILRIAPELHQPTDMIQVLGIKGEGTGQASTLTPAQINSLTACPTRHFNTLTNSFTGEGI